MKRFLLRMTSMPKGTVLIELAFVTALIISMLYGALELARALRVQQEISVASRESAAQSFRVCALKNDPQSCLDDTRQLFANFINSRAPGSEIILSVYKYQGAGPNPILEPESVILWKISGVANYTGLTPGGNRSKFTPPDIGGVVDLYRPVPRSEFHTDSVSSGNAFIAISEIYNRYVPIGLRAPAVSALNGLLLYENTIY